MFNDFSNLHKGNPYSSSFTQNLKHSTYYIVPVSMLTVQENTNVLN